MRGCIGFCLYRPIYLIVVVVEISHPMVDRPNYGTVSLRV